VPHRARQRQARHRRRRVGDDHRIGGNIVAFDQFSDDHRGGAYFQRVVFHRPDFALERPAIEIDIAAPSPTSSWSGR
jgi:hypothetical protein